MTLLFKHQYGEVMVYQDSRSYYFCRFPRTTASPYLIQLANTVMLQWDLVTDFQDYAKTPEHIHLRYWSIDERVSYLEDRISGQIHIYGDPKETEEIIFNHKAELERLDKWSGHVRINHRFSNWTACRIGKTSYLIDE
jgi:hypothetical protein